MYEFYSPGRPVSVCLCGARPAAPRTSNQEVKLKAKAVASRSTVRMTLRRVRMDRCALRAAVPVWSRALNA